MGAIGRWRRELLGGRQLVCRWPGWPGQLLDARQGECRRHVDRHHETHWTVGKPLLVHVRISRHCEHQPSHANVQELTWLSETLEAYNITRGSDYPPADVTAGITRTAPLPE